VRLTRFAFRIAATTFATAGLVAAGVFATAPAYAATTTSPDVAAVLSARLGAHAAGSYLDSTGRMVVNVTDGAAAQQVRAAGAVAQVVTRTAAQLQAATDSLNRSVTVAGTAWWIDPVTNQVVVSVDRTVTGTGRATVVGAVARLGGMARLESDTGVFSTRLAGGDAIYGGNFRCSLGFNARNSAGQRFFVTAGHCGVAASQWYSDGAHRNLIGTTVRASFPGNDYAVIRYASNIAQQPGAIDLYNGSTQDITRAGNAFVGQAVRRSGSTTHVRSGTVLALNATVRYAEGAVTGLIRTNVCAEPGDSGGALFAGSTALGLTSGGSGNCSSGGTTFFQPVTEALSSMGISVY
jgi:streptogrisin D